MAAPEEAVSWASNKPGGMISGLGQERTGLWGASAQVDHVADFRAECDGPW